MADYSTIPFGAVEDNQRRTPFDLLGSIGKLEALRGLQGENQIRQMQIQNAQQAQVDDQHARDLFASNPNPTPDEILSKLGPVHGMSVLKAQHEASKADFEKKEKALSVATAQTTRLAQITASVKDQPSYESAVKQAISEGLIQPEMLQRLPAQYDPNTVAGLQQQALTANERMTQAREQVKQEWEAKRQGFEEALRGPQMQEAVAKAKTATDTAMGNAPIQPLQQKTLDQTAAHQAEMERQGRVGLGLRSQEVGIQAQKRNDDEGAIERVAQSMAGGDLSRIRDVASLRGDQRLKLYDRIKQINPKFEIATVDRQIKNEDYYANGKGAENLRSFGTFLEHVGGAMDATQAIRLSKSPLINKPLNYWRTNVAGSPDLVRLEAAIEPAKKEYESFLLGGHALQTDDRQTANRILDPGKYSPAQIEEALKTISHVAEARFREENWKYKKVSGHDLQDPFSPEAVAGAAKVGMRLPTGGSQAGGYSVSVNGKTYSFPNAAALDGFKQAAGIK